MFGFIICFFAERVKQHAEKESAPPLITVSHKAASPVGGSRSIEIFFVVAEVLDELGAVAPVLLDLYPRLQKHLAIEEALDILTREGADFF